LLFADDVTPTVQKPPPRMALIAAKPLSPRKPGVATSDQVPLTPWRTSGS